MNKSTKMSNSGGFHSGDNFNNNNNNNGNNNSNNNNKEALNPLQDKRGNPRPHTFLMCTTPILMFYEQRRSRDRKHRIIHEFWAAWP